MRGISSIREIDKYNSESDNSTENVFNTSIRKSSYNMLTEEEKKTVTNPYPIQSSAASGPDQDTIDLFEVFRVIAHNIWAILLTALLGAFITAGVTRFLITPMYTSTSMMIVLTKETTIASIADLQIGTQLTNDYKVLIQSRPVLEKTIKQTGLSIDYQKLRDMITVTNAQDTRILEISVEQPDPKLAKKVCDALTNISSEYIADKMEVQAPKVIEEGEISPEQTSPNMAINVTVGFLVGFLAAAAVVVIRYLMNESIVTEDDVERYLGLTTLASIPEKESEKRERSRRSRKVRHAEQKGKRSS